MGTPDLTAINWFRVYHAKTASITTRIDAIELHNSDLNAVNDLRFGDNEVSVFPNPAQNLLNIKLFNTNSRILNLTLVDLSGKILIRKTINSRNISDSQLNVSQLNTGLYLLKITSEKQTVTKKINIKYMSRQL